MAITVTAHSSPAPRSASLETTRHDNPKPKTHNPSSQKHQKAKQALDAHHPMNTPRKEIACTQNTCTGIPSSPSAPCPTSRRWNRLYPTPENNFATKLTHPLLNTIQKQQTSGFQSRQKKHFTHTFFHKAHQLRARIASQNPKPTKPTGLIHPSLKPLKKDIPIKAHQIKKLKKKTR